jgi:hypothetical protein
MTNNKEQTTVEWFIEELEEKGKAYEENQVVRTINICIDVSDYMELKIQAKDMEKEKTIKFTEDWYFNGPLLGGGVDVVETIEKHYNKTYGNDKQ